MTVALKASYDKKRSKDVALILAEIIRASTDPGKLEICMKSGSLSFLYISQDDSPGIFDVQSIIDAMTDVELFKYDVASKEVAEEKESDRPSCNVSRESPDENSGVSEASEETEKKETEEDSEEPKEEEKKGDKDSMPPVKYQVLDILKNLPEDSEGVNAAYIAKILKIERSKAAAHLTSLLKDGKIRRLSRGIFKVASEKQEETSSAPKEEKDPVVDDTTEKESKKEPDDLNDSTKMQAKDRLDIVSQSDFKRYKELSEVPFFSEIDSMIDFTVSRESNVQKVLNILYSIEKPSEAVRNDLFVRIIVAVTLVPERVNYETIDANLEDYVTGVTEESRRLAEAYLTRVFNTRGYTTTYLKFLKALNDQFMGRYNEPDWSFIPKKVEQDKPQKKVKVRGVPENEEFEVFLGKISENKTAGSKAMEKIVDYMDPKRAITNPMREDVYEVFRVSYGLKKISSDYIFVNGKFKNNQPAIETAIQNLVDSFISKLTPEYTAKITYINFLRNLNEALRKA